MSNEIQHFQPEAIELMAKRVAASRLFPGIQTPEAAFTLMLLCQSEGLHPMQAVRRYHIIEGRPSMRADAMLAEFQRQGGKVEWQERSESSVRAVFSHAAGGSVTITWTIEDAKRAGLWGKGNWTKYPRHMLTARVISEGIRTVLPGVVAGIYTPEEVADFDQPAAASPARPRPGEQVIETTAEEFAPAPAASWPDFVGRVLAHWAELDPADWTESEARRHRLLNHLVSAAIEMGGIDERQVSRRGAKGATVRDKDKALAAIREIFESDANWRNWLRVEASRYIKDKSTSPTAPEVEPAPDARLMTPVDEAEAERRAIQEEAMSN